MGTTNKHSSGGVGFLGLLGIAFIILKLTNYIGWSWWWVLAPIWTPLAVLLIIVLLLGILALIDYYSK